MSEFLRVLKPGGFAVITSPDLQAVCALVAEDKLTEPAYTSPAGPIFSFYILYRRGPHLVRVTYTRVIVVDLQRKCCQELYDLQV